MAVKQEFEQDARSFLQKVAATALDLAHSQKVQIFVLGHILAVLTTVLGVVAKRHGIDPAIIGPALDKALIALGVTTTTLIGAHAYVDSAATAAQITAAGNKPIEQVGIEALQAELAATKADVAKKTAQLQALTT